MVLQWKGKQFLYLQNPASDNVPFRHNRNTHLAPLTTSAAGQVAQMWFKGMFRKGSRACLPKDGQDKDGTTLTAEHVEHQENVDVRSSRPPTTRQLHE